MNHLTREPAFEMPPDELSDALVRLRRLGENDLDELFSVASDPLIWEQHPANDRYERRVFQKFFEKALKGGGAFAIIDRKTKEIIGSSRYYDIAKEPDSVAIGYTFLARKYWGGDYNRSVKKLMISHAFKFAGRVLFHIGADNLRSQKAVEKLGAVKIKEIPPENEGDGLRYEYLIER